MIVLSDFARQFVTDLSESVGRTEGDIVESVVVDYMASVEAWRRVFDADPPKPLFPFSMGTDQVPISGQTLFRYLYGIHLDQLTRGPFCLACGGQMLREDGLK
jgi:hypothetical protein